MAKPTVAIDPFDEAFLVDPFAQHAGLRDPGAVVPRIAEIRPTAPPAVRLNNTFNAPASVPVRLVAS